MVPRATYRIQFHKGFGFDQAATLAPYLARLGISHLYASPYLKARPGSTHGYDIVDHDALNPELGDQAAFERMVAALRQHGLCQILDFVPNHMGVGGAGNPLWLDVLEWGRDSIYAGWFDIDWDPDQEYLKNKLLIPVLGDQYGRELEAGKLSLKYDEREGSFAVWAYDAHKLPIGPPTYSRILGDAIPELERLADSFSSLPSSPEAQGLANELKSAMAAQVRASAHVRQALGDAVARINGVPGQRDAWRGLAALIEDQHWVPAHFRAAADDINYRRFFNINDLAGLRIEQPDVFDHAHRLVFRLLADGTLEGLRIDHIDGLLDPNGYLTRLREKAGTNFYLVVEKILGPAERLRAAWPVDGTTGYDFTNLMLGLLVDGTGAETFERTYVSFTGQTKPFADLERDCKLHIMTHEMASELDKLAREATRIARQNVHTRDFTRNTLHQALKEIVACFPIYRTYLDTSGPDTEGRISLATALAQARRNQPDIHPSVFDFLSTLLSGDLVAEPRSGYSRETALRFAMKFQQYSGPVMAKGVEDTAFYRYNRFIALNEVGGSPQRFGLSLKEFHQQNQWRVEHGPATMLATATHDTKRGEDTRARLAALSELPDEWAEQLEGWSDILGKGMDGVEPGGPDRNDEYMFFQMLIGSWPVELLGTAAPDAEVLATFYERIKGALIKSVREAKVHSTWAAPNSQYESALLALAEKALDTSCSPSFIDAVRPFAERIASLGARNSLIQTVLKLTLPGVPDVYQGTELWDFSMVDPDNRRTIDYTLRLASLERVQRTLATDRGAGMHGLMHDWTDGSFKLATLTKILELRREWPHLFAEGNYTPLPARGPCQDAICAFSRTHERQTIIVVVGRFPRRLESLKSDTLLSIPPRHEATAWRELFTGESGRVMRGSLALTTGFAAFPAAIFVEEIEP